MPQPSLEWLRYVTKTNSLRQQQRGFVANYELFMFATCQGKEPVTATHVREVDLVSKKNGARSRADVPTHSSDLQPFAYKTCCRGEDREIAAGLTWAEAPNSTLVFSWPLFSLTLLHFLI